jgi:predicted RNA-binding Zn-ribbon protein involved in translation (DUF1610 family)
MRTACFTGPMAMICPDCQQNLDDVPVGDPCPQCGGVRRSAVVQAQAQHYVFKRFQFDLAT